MLEPTFIRNNPEKVKNNLKKRKQKELINLVDEFIKKDKIWRSLKKDLDGLRHKRNIVSEEINQLIKQKKDPKEKIKEIKLLPKNIKDKEQKSQELEKQIKVILYKIPNMLHSSVPYGVDDSNNKTVRKNGTIKKFKFDLKSHGELAENLGVADFQKAAEVSGSGFVYLKGSLALLDIALQRFAIDFLIKKKFTLVEPPLMLRRNTYESVTSLEDFQNVMYKIEDEDLYLIATSEHPLVSLYKNTLLKEDKLPIKLVGVSPCFRKEIGSHGVDTRGVFRMHQFNKVEQVIISNQKDSLKLHEELQKNAEQLMKKLKLPYKVVNVCTGDIGIIAAKKYDIEAYYSREKQYKEVTSASNCTSYQAVRLNIKYKNKKGEKLYVHTLNATGIATSRIMRAILEHYQLKDGSVKIPTVLQKYMNGIKKIE